MKTLLVFIICGFFVGMWAYAIAMTAREMIARGEMTKTWFIVMSPLAVVGMFVDIIVFNFIIATAVYRELPRELTFSSRIERHYRTPPRRGFRQSFTFWWVRQLNAVTSAQTGDHIHL